MKNLFTIVLVLCYCGTAFAAADVTAGGAFKTISSVTQENTFHKPSLDLSTENNSTKATVSSDSSKTVNASKTMDSSKKITSVYVNNGSIDHSINNNGKTISTYTSGSGLHSFQMNLNLKTGTISYYNKYSGKTVTLTKSGNATEYKNSLKNMISSVKGALTSSASSKLSTAQINFLKSTLKTLNSYLK